MEQSVTKKDEHISCSVIIRTKDRPRHLYRAVESIREQEKKPDELIVVNDGGESVKSVLEAFSDLPIVLIDHAVSKGRSKAGNAGAGVASGAAICFLDDDDRFFPDHLKRLLLCMLKFDAKVAYAGSRLVQKDLLGETEAEQEQVIGEFNEEFEPERLEFENYIPLNTLMIDRNLFWEVGGFDAAFNLFEDWDLLLRLARKTRFYHLSRVTSEYAVWGKAQQITLSSRTENWRHAYSRMFAKHFLGFSDREKIKLMANYWLLSQERRGRIKALEKTVQDSHREREKLCLQMEREREKDQGAMQREIHHLQSRIDEYRKDRELEQGRFIKKMNALKSALRLQQEKKELLKQTIHEQSKQLTLGLGSNEIRSLLTAQTGQIGPLSKDIIKDNYERLVKWIKNHEVRITDEVEAFFERWHLLEEELAALEEKTAFLLTQLHGSKLRKVWRGIPIPQVTSLLEKNKAIRQLMADASVDAITGDTGLLLPKEKKPLEWDAEPNFVECTPAFEAFSGNKENFELMFRVDEPGTLAVALKDNKRLCFSVCCTHNHFFCLKLMLATYVRINTCDIRVLIFEAGNAEKHKAPPLRHSEFNAIDVLDNQYHTILFDPIPDSRGKVYEIEVDSPNATPEQHIAVWCHPLEAGTFSEPREKGEISHSLFDARAVLYPWMKHLLREVPLAGLLNTRQKNADHHFWIYNPPLGDPSGFLPVMLLQLSKMAVQMKCSVAVVVYGPADHAVETYCLKNRVEYRVMDGTVLQGNQALPWVLEQAETAASGSDGLIWFLRSGLRPGGELLGNAETFFKDHPDTGLVLPMVENHVGKVSHAFGQITREGNIHTFPVGMAALHPANGYVRTIDAADAPFFVMRADLMKDIFLYPELAAYHTVGYQMTELIWQLKEKEVEAKFEPGLSFVGDRFTDELSGDMVEADRLCFFKRWKSTLFYKPPAYDNVYGLLNPDKRATALIIDMTLPTFDEDSGSLRMFEMLTLFTELGIKITFFPDNLDNTPKYRRALERMGIEVFCGNYGISDALAGRQYDMIILSRVDIGHRYMNLVKLLNPNARIYYDTVDIHYVREFRQAEIEEDEALKRTAVKTRQKELANCIMADVVFTVTEEDKNHLLKEIPSLDCFVLPNIHRKLSFDIAWEKTDGLVFIGNYNHPPNEDAVFYFVEKVFPLIQARIPDITLYLIGSNMPERMKKLESGSIRVLGWVEAVEPELVKRRVMVSYLRYGAGMKGKIGQAMSVGLPVVSTAIGAEGMGLEDGDTVLVADEPDTFADKVCHAYTEKKLWKKISKRSQDYIYDQYGTGVVGEKLRSFLDMDLKRRFPIIGQRTEM